jgi:hypothetical protein
MRARGWTEAEVAERILPFMPPTAAAAPSGGDASAGGPPAVSLPARVSAAWLDRHLPPMSRKEMSAVVEELERRGWAAGDVAVAVLPHLLPKLPPADADAILAGLKALGMTEGEVARLAPGG